MVSRDPETGQFTAGNRGDEDPYLNCKHLYYSNSWGSDDGTGTKNDFDETSNRNSLKVVEIDRPDDHLVEIHGVKFHVSDPGEDGKVLNWVLNEKDPEPFGFGDVLPDYGDHIIASHAIQANTGGGVGNGSETAVWLPKPMLSTGKIGCHKRAGTVDAGEIGASIYYTLREFDENTVVQQLLQNR